MCRKYYRSNMHCSCHSHWINDVLPYWASSFANRVYYKGDDDSITGECTICLATLYPYKDREPCDFEIHHHDHHQEKELHFEITRNKKGKNQINFCHTCERYKAFQCCFCAKNFPTQRLADEHISKHHGELEEGDVSALSCLICDRKEEWERVKKDWKLQKWISWQLKLISQSVVKADLGEIEENASAEQDNGKK